MSWEGVLGENICWVCAAGISAPLPYYSQFMVCLLPFKDPILVTFGHYSLFLVYFVANFRPYLSHFWANNFLTLKIPKTCDPILVTLLKMQPHYSSRENATPSSGTSSVAHY